MCFSGRCPYELWSGECGKRPHQVCPESCEDEEDYERRCQEAQDDYEAAMDQKYEEMKDRRLGL